MSTFSAENRKDVGECIKSSISSMESLFSAEHMEASERMTGRRRSGATLRQQPRLQLVDVDGVLRWRYRDVEAGPSGRRSLRAIAATAMGDVVVDLPLKPLNRNQVLAAMQSLDDSLTPSRGLRVIHEGQLVKAPEIEHPAKVLLFIHGTFSKGEALYDELKSTEDGHKFLHWAHEHYDHVLFFDHPTLAVSPILNAVELSTLLAGRCSSIDIIAHSRGGIVAAWAAKGMKLPLGIVCTLGSPLDGTSLASPYRLRDTLDYFANVAAACKLATGALGAVPFAGPLFAATAGLMSVLQTVLYASAKTPLIDAGIAIVPGLAAQSRVDNNPERIALQDDRTAAHVSGTFIGVTANFSPQHIDEPIWQFWKRWQRLPWSVANKVTDAIFESANDLVVDCDSAKKFCGAPAAATQIFDFGDTHLVHHCNYLTQSRTLDFVKTHLTDRHAAAGRT
ncbi:MAG: hypothetical protein SF172_03365 [Burkholderiales bacterium]|nr:hypothetical protein [Burkholderiales bacterium]